MINFFLRLKKAKQKYMTLNPYEKWYFLRKIHTHMVKLVGCEVMEEDFKINVNTLIPIYVEVNYLTLLTYTLIYYRNDLFHALIATPSVGILIPVSPYFRELYFIQQFSFLTKRLMHFTVFDSTHNCTVSTNSSTIATFIPFWR